MVVVPIVVIAMILVIPMTLVVGPTAIIVVVMRMAPIRPGIRRPAPYSGDPHIPCPGPVPISVRPDIARTGNRRPNLIAQRRRSSADVNTDLSKGWSSKC